MEVQQSRVLNDIEESIGYLCQSSISTSNYKKQNKKIRILIDTEDDKLNAKEEDLMYEIAGYENEKGLEMADLGITSDGDFESVLNTAMIRYHCKPLTN